MHPTDREPPDGLGAPRPAPSRALDQGDGRPSASVGLLGVFVERVDVLEGVAADGALLVCEAHVLAQAGRGVELEVTGLTDEVLCRRHGRGSPGLALSILLAHSESAPFASGGQRQARGPLTRLRRRRGRPARRSCPLRALRR